MQAAFIGNESKIAFYSKVLQSAIISSKTDKLNICGVLSVSPEATTNLAISLNAKAYLSLDDLLKDADIIFVCRHDSRLAAFSDILKEKRVRGKILCHFSTKYDSSILSCGSTNTCFCIGFPYPIKACKGTENLFVSFEGEGKNSQLFENTMKLIFPNSVFCTKNDKRLSAIASRIITDYLKVLINISMHFFKISGMYDEDSFAQFASLSIKDIIASKSSRQIRKRSESEIKKDMRLLSVVNYNDTKDFYKNMETHIADTGIYLPDEKETILRALKKKI